MYISPRLYVGSAPEWAHNAKPANNAQSAASIIDQGFIAVVPSTDMAYQTLLLLGSSPEHALRATTWSSVLRTPMADAIDFGTVPSEH